MNDTDWMFLRTLYETRNVTMAAEMLHVSKTSLYSRLKFFENRFGTAITARGKSGIEFTAAGEFLVKYADEMLEKLGSVHEQINNISVELRGTLRIASSNYCTRYFLPELLAEFKNKYPQVDFIVTSGSSSEVLQKIMDSNVHIGFIRNNSMPLNKRNFFCTEKVFVCSKKDIDLNFLPEEPQVACKDDPFDDSELHAWWIQSYNKSPNIAMNVDNTGASAEMVQRGLGYGFFTERIADQMRGIHKYEMKFRDGRPYTRQTWLACSKGANELAMVSRFLEFTLCKAYE